MRNSHAVIVPYMCSRFFCLTGYSLSLVLISWPKAGLSYRFADDYNHYNHSDQP